MTARSNRSTYTRRPQGPDYSTAEGCEAIAAEHARQAEFFRRAGADAAIRFHQNKAAEMMQRSVTLKAGG